MSVKLIDLRVEVELLETDELEDFFGEIFVIFFIFGRSSVLMDRIGSIVSFSAFLGLKEIQKKKLSVLSPENFVSCSLK